MLTEYLTGSAGLVVALVLTAMIIFCTDPEEARAMSWDRFWVSTGDHQWMYDLVPVDSAETIDSVFESMVSYGVKRVYWRGEQDCIRLDNHIFRPENALYYDYWEWNRHLNRTIKNNDLAVAAARRHGLEVFYFDGLFEYGAQGDTPECPNQTEDRIRFQHPEWVSCDRWGERRAPGPLEYAYPGARKLFVDRVMKHVQKYDGIILYTYVENFGFRYPEEFGFNEPIVKEFKRRYGVDIRTEEFDQDAWNRLRGEYVTQLITELHTALSKKGKKLAIIVWADNPSVPQGWQQYSKWTTIGWVHMDYEKWVREGIVDEIAVLHYDPKFVAHLLEIPKARPLSIVVLGGPVEEQVKAGVKSVVDIWDGICYGRYTSSTVTADDFNNPNWIIRAQVLADVASGALKIEASDVAKAVSDKNVLVRRSALRALAALDAKDQLPVIEKALDDEESSVRIAAAAVLKTINGPESAAHLIEALRQHGMFQMKNASAAAMEAMIDQFEPVMVTGLTDKSIAVREVCARALAKGTTKESETALMDVLRKDPDYRVRYWALTSLTERPDAALAACRLGIDDKSTTVQLSAARGFGKLAPEMSDVQATQTLETLNRLFKEYGDGCKRSDASWGWRAVGNAIAAFGDRGKKDLEAYRTQTEDKWLAWFTYQVLYVPQFGDNACLTTEKEAVEAHTKYAPPFPGLRMEKLGG